MVVLEEGRQRLAGHPRQHAGLALDHHHLGAEGAAGGGRLQPDIAAADHRQPLAGADGGLQRLGVGGGAQLQHAGQAGAGDGQLAGPRAGGQDQDVIGNGLAVGQGDDLLAAIDRDGDRVQAQVHAVLGVEFQGLERQAVGVGLALEPGLGQGRALVGRDGLLADQDDGAGEAVLTQERRRRAAGVSGPHDHYALLAQWRSPCRRAKMTEASFFGKRIVGRPRSARSQ